MYLTGHLWPVSVFPGDFQLIAIGVPGFGTLTTDWPGNAESRYA
jgi:hypothetical protein